MIEVKELTYQIKDKIILDKVSFQVGNKEKIAVIGPNGSGKTTLLRHIYKDISVSQGEILLDDFNINNIKAGQHLSLQHVHERLLKLYQP